MACARSPRTGNGPLHAHCRSPSRAALLHAQFYSAVLAALLVVYVFQEDLRVAVFLAYSFWVPQIVKNARENTRRAFHPLFLYGTAANRLALPLYCFGSRANVLRVLADDRDIATRRDLGFCAALSSNLLHSQNARNKL